MCALTAWGTKKQQKKLIAVTVTVTATVTVTVTVVTVSHSTCVVAVNPPSSTASRFISSSMFR